ncbi:hypothetical protein IYW40_04655 [Methylocystis sp. H4A]|uniref:hypothetical protein n=1 Tax=Methylocystis sp. H4A TaxID=2785788 RepID=UPI0018C2A00B|nr:hypothetical protein [Methylocystis sp. H4A]MBG0800784.1 hypothetical protein [Methylocystis sp. H4A]
MRPLVSLRQSLEDPALLGGVMGGPTRQAMRSILLASQGEPLNDAELAHWRTLTGREVSPGMRAEECHIFAGRRSGKSSGIAALITYAACLCDFSDRLSPGETGIALLIAENQKQARIMLRYIEGALDQSTALRKLIVGRTQHSIRLSNGIEIEVRPADFRGLRGPSYIIVCADEINFWRSEDSANPDYEIIDAIRPGLVTTHGQLFTIGSPYRKAGFGFSMFAKHFGDKGDPQIIVAKGATRQFNSTVPQKVIDRAIERDPQSAQAEWLGDFRNDIDAFLPREVVEACVIPNRFEIPPMSGTRYFAFADPSGGSSDDMTLAIAHRENNIAVLDCVRVAHPPFSPDAVCADFASTLRAYGLHSVKGDRYAGEWPVERFRHHGIRYESAQKPKVEIYKDSIPLYSAQRCELLDHPKLTNQLIGLERRTSRGGRDSIDHPPGGHDDVANSVCGALLLACAGKHVFRPTQRMVELAGMPGPRYRQGDSMRHGVKIVPF